MSEDSIDKERDWQRERAEGQLRHLAAEMAANLLRVVRGAGRSYEIAQHSAALVVAYEAFLKVDGNYPPSAIIEQAVGWEKTIEYGADREHQANRHYAEEQIIRGALQVVASRILGQVTQEAAGRREMHAGLRGWQEASEAVRSFWASQAPRDPAAARAALQRARAPLRKRSNDK